MGCKGALIVCNLHSSTFNCFSILTLVTITDAKILTVCLGVAGDLGDARNTASFAYTKGLIECTQDLDFLSSQQNRICLAPNRSFQDHPATPNDPSIIDVGRWTEWPVAFQ